MPAIKKGYSEKHNQHPNWLYVPAFDCHVRVTALGSMLGWITDYVDGTRYKKQRNWIGWFLGMNGRWEKGNKLWGSEQRMYVGLEKNKELNIKLLSDSLEFFPETHNFCHFKKRGVLFAVHWYNNKASICIIGSESPPDDARKIYCFKNYGYYPLMKSNLHSLKAVFDKLDWDVEMRFNWMKLALADDLENNEIAAEMLKGYFNETNN